MLPVETNWTGHTLRTNCILKLVIEGNIEVKGRWGIRRKQLIDELTKRKRYWNLEEEALDRTVWRTHFGRGQTKEWMNQPTKQSTNQACPWSGTSGESNSSLGLVFVAYSYVIPNDLFKSKACFSISWHGIFQAGGPSLFRCPRMLF